MTEQEFNFIVEKANERSMNILYIRGREYTTEDEDRLGQFKDAAKIKGCNPAEALIDQATKQFGALVNMARNPTKFPLALWQERAGDLRNYTLLIEGLIRDLGVK